MPIEAIFRPEVMAECIPSAGGLMRKVLSAGRLKKEMFMLLPELRGCAEQFEPVWQVCRRAVEQCCGRLQRAKLSGLRNKVYY